MRVLQGRGDWHPGFRIPSLRRYAFIGDSFTYGSGVAPNQTLPANAERQLNELLPAWPVEAVNLGVGGYNLWNSWLGFKYGSQIYDGVVLVLCLNDADLFGRSYRVEYPEPHQTRWESSHPFGEAVTRCFDDIASFSQERSLPVAVVYYNVDGDWRMLRIGKIIADLCAARGLPFIDTLAHFRDRQFKRDDLVASSADSHPSALAHEAAGRHLAATLKRQGWFRETEASAIGDAPDRILEAARAMVGKDHYPPDAALNWALGALDAKSRVAHRMQASGAEDDFSIAAARTGEALTTASRRWHVINRTRALMHDIAAGGSGMAGNVFRIQEEGLRFEELCFALGTGDWNRLAAGLPHTGETPQIAPDKWSSDAAGFFAGCSVDLLHLRKALDGLRRTPAAGVFGSLEDEALMTVDLEALARIADRAETGFTELKASFLRLESVFRDARPALTEEQVAHISNLIGAALKNGKDNFGFVPRLSTAIGHIRDVQDVAFTTVEVTIRSKSIQNRPLSYLGGTVVYSAPGRLPCSDAGSFLPDGSVALVKLRFPVFYAGRLYLRDPKTAANQTTVEATIVKVELYNGKNPRRIVEAASFQKDKNGQLFSPILCVP